MRVAGGKLPLLPAPCVAAARYKNNVQTSTTYATVEAAVTHQALLRSFLCHRKHRYTEKYKTADSAHHGNY
jgi:hypothetical protein